MKQAYMFFGGEIDVRFAKSVHTFDVNPNAQMI